MSILLRSMSDTAIFIAAEIDSFLADASTNAFEKVVDRLLASEAFGERMAVDWLDLARYSDTHGYQADRYRAMNASELDRAIRGTVDPDDFVYVVVGDAKVVRPQLQSLGLPIEEMRMTPAAAQPQPQPQPATPAAPPAPAPAVPTEGERG